MIVRLSTFLLTALIGMITIEPAAAQDYRFIGKGRLVSNDLFVSTLDRWRTSNVAISYVFGRNDIKHLPSAPGDMLEFRFRGEILAPEYLRNPAPGDRPFAGVLAIGLHNHFTRGGLEYSLGADLSVTGPQTRLAELQEAIHNVWQIDATSDPVRAAQIPNGEHLGGTLEIGKHLTFGDASSARPFVEVQTGLETLTRVGVDFHIGEIGQNDIWARDVSSGQRYRIVRSGNETGFAFVIGADIAKVTSSKLLPETQGFRLTPTRNRVRTGIHWQRGQSTFFYGATWLGREFEAQRESQIIGALRIDLKF